MNVLISYLSLNERYVVSIVDTQKMVQYLFKKLIYPHDFYKQTQTIITIWTEGEHVSILLYLNNYDKV